MRKRIALLSNVMAELFRHRLKRHYDVYIPEGYNTWMQEVLNPQSGLYEYHPEAVFLLLDSTEFRNQNKETIEEKIVLWEQTVDVLAMRLSVEPLFISTIDIRESKVRAVCERSYALEMKNSWYQHIQELAGQKNNIYCFELAELITDIGRKQFYDRKCGIWEGCPTQKKDCHASAMKSAACCTAPFLRKRKS